MNNKQNNEEKKKKFVPRTTPRYLPGSEDHTVLRKDLKSYNDHLYNIYSAETKIDTKPPKFHTMRYMNMVAIGQGAERLRDLERENREMVRKINMINRSGGHVDTWNPNAYNTSSKWRLNELDHIRIKKENATIYNRLINAKPMYPKEEHDEFYKKVEKKMSYFQKYPHYKITTKDDELHQQMSLTEGLDIKTNQNSRIRCYLVFQIAADCNISLGRITIELYNDICPQTCENFIALMSKTAERTVSYINCPVHKIYKNKYLLTGDITHGTGRGGVSSTGEDLPLENFTLRHSKAGVLSMLTLNGGNNSQFCITFEALPKFDGKQVAFGKVIHGAANLFKVNDFGRKFGKPISNIVISKCGIIKTKGR